MSWTSWWNKGAVATVIEEKKTDTADLIFDEIESVLCDYSTRFNKATLNDYISIDVGNKIACFYGIGNTDGYCISIGSVCFFWGEYPRVKDLCAKAFKIYKARRAEEDEAVLRKLLSELRNK